MTTTCQLHGHLCCEQSAAAAEMAINSYYPTVDRRRAAFRERNALDPNLKCSIESTEVRIASFRQATILTVRSHLVELDVVSRSAGPRWRETFPKVDAAAMELFRGIEAEEREYQRRRREAEKALRRAAVLERLDAEAEYQQDCCQAASDSDEMPSRGDYGLNARGCDE
jgi:hypothetical protein